LRGPAPFRVRRPSLGARIACAGAVLAGCAAEPASGPRAVEPQDLQAAIQAEVEQVCAEAGFPGMTAAVVMPDGRLLAAAAGWGDEARRIPMTPSSRMPAGSTGKMFTAAAILLAVDEGVLDLDAPIERWLGREAWFARVPNAPDLTLRRLLSHRSGIGDPFEDEAFLRAITTELEKPWTPRDLLAFVLDEPPESRAGTSYSYTDVNFDLAGVVFETAVGRPLFAEIERRLLRPLHLDDTLPQERRDWTGVVPGRLDPVNPVSAATGKRTSTVDGEFVYALQAEYAGGGLISTSSDLARWARELFEGRAISKDRLEDMLDAQPAEGKTRYGLGVSVSPSNAGPVYGHDGWAPGYLTIVVWFADVRLAAALQVNSDPMDRYALTPNEALGRVVSLAMHRLGPGGARAPERGSSASDR
jgi:D-alanyl-D-alanine carboxypeptidase